MLLGIAVEFWLFALTLIGIALTHRYTLPIALAGLVVITLSKLIGPGFAEGAGFIGLEQHFAHESITLVNLLGLLVAFAVIARWFEDSGLPLVLPKYLPDDWTGAFMLLCVIFVMSGFLDNIAAALIGGSIAHALFRGRVHIGYIAAIVAASNAGGSGSVLGDTTTTMMWISGIAPREVVHAYVGAVVALVTFGLVAAHVQQRWSPIMKDPPRDVHVDSGRLAAVVWVLGCAIAANVYVSTQLGEASDAFPYLGVTVLAAVVIGSIVRRPEWHVLPAALRTAAFLLALVSIASMMPVDELPDPSPLSTFALGTISAVFDNIPLTALALRQGGYDWGVLAYAVGFGGSMIWFGSSAGVAISSIYPEVRSVRAWLRHGWPVAAGYALGFAALVALLGWRP
jgi:Na+/H+ antiporter NhaD/arsenite permease-like protein